MGSAYALLLAFLFSFSLQTPALASKEGYIVFLGERPLDLPLQDVLQRVTQSHYNLLASALGGLKQAQDAMLYSYAAIDAFAAFVEESDAAALRSLPGVLSVMPDSAYQLQTTRSWDFMGLELDSNGDAKDGTFWDLARLGEDTIIATLDSGVWPESRSFNDFGMGPVPSRWKGTCVKGTDPTFSCNRKLIGAKYFSLGYRLVNLLNGFTTTEPNSPPDNNGHGTHTLSTAGGAFVPGASVFGYGNGTAKGGSPRARVASYKVCWGAGTCSAIDMLGGLNWAIVDGVDVLSISVGAPPTTYTQDPIAIGTFRAVQKGIAVVCAGGNSGPQPGSVSNVAPWIFTVGASTMDRDFLDYVSFSDTKIRGQSLSDSSLPYGNYTMINGENANAPNQPPANSTLCVPGSLDPNKVKGKIVVCTRGLNPRVEKGQVVKAAGGLGMVLVNDAASGNGLVADAHVLPAIHISYDNGRLLFSYLKSTSDPRGYISTTNTQLGIKPAPVMAAFSSQGPNTITPQILKPDITAPGVSVIAAFSEGVPLTGLPSDPRRIPYNIESGTSMACPHVSGIVGLFKTLKPKWSPAAIRSAIMTSATTVDNTGNPIQSASGAPATPFSYGSGHVEPNKSMNPGLVYDTTPNDYLNFLCANGLKPIQLALFNGGVPFTCTSGFRAEDLNYPSITVPNLSGAVMVKRRVKNVGSPSSKYTVRMTAPSGVNVTVAPTELSFSQPDQEKEFQVILELVNSAAAANYVFGSIVWTDDQNHYVRSPLAVKAA